MKKSGVWTLDLDSKCVGKVSKHPVDTRLTKIHMGARLLDFVESNVDAKITILTGNSITFDFSEWKDSIHFVLIDGGHDLQTLRSDTESASRFVGKKRPACILWHDCGNRHYPELTEYPEGLSCEKPLFHVEDTMLSVRFSWEALPASEREKDYRLWSRRMSCLTSEQDLVKIENELIIESRRFAAPYRTGANLVICGDGFPSSIDTFVGKESPGNDACEQSA